MTSILAQQLKNIVLSQHGTTQRQPRGKPSLLFTPQEAADLDLLTIYNIGLRGLMALAEMDGRFEEYLKTLFSHDGMEMDREMQTPAINQKLNSSLSSFLSLLSSYLLLPPAHQALEYLIRRFKIHVYNVEAVMVCVLPYHETNLFVRIVQLLQIERTRWEFLQGVRENGTALPREVLVVRCMKDLAVLDAICEMARSASDVKVGSQTVMSFCTVMVMEVIGMVTFVSDELVRRILPFVLDGFKKDASAEIQAGALMITVQLASRTTLSESLAFSLIRNIAKMPQIVRGKDDATFTPPLLKEALMTIIHIAQTQPIATFPGKVLKTLLKIRQFPSELGSLSEMFNTSKFMQFLVRFLVQQSAQQKRYEEKLVKLVRELAMEDYVALLTSELLNLCFGEDGSCEEDGDVEDMVDSDAASKEEKAGKTKAMVQRVVAVLDKMYPAQFDEAVNSLMKRTAAVQKKAGVSGDDKGQRNRLEEMFNFFREALHGSLHMPLIESNASLYLSVDHPQARIREMSIKKLGEIADMDNNGENEQLYVFLSEALLRRLQDDSPLVVKAVLSLRCLVEVVPPAPLFEALTKTIESTESALSKGLGFKESPFEAIEMIQRILEFLATSFLEKHSKFTERVSMYLLGFFLPRSWGSHLSWRAMELASAIPFPLFSKLWTLVPTQAVKVVVDQTKTNPLWKRNVIEAMAAAALEMNGEDGDGEEMLTGMSNYLKAVSDSESHGTAKLVVLLMLLQCMGDLPDDRRMKLSAMILPALSKEWASIDVSVDSNLAVEELPKIDYDQWEMNSRAPLDFFQQQCTLSEIDIDPESLQRVKYGTTPPPVPHFWSAYVETLLRTLYAVVKSINPSSSSSCQEGSNDQGSFEDIFILFATSSQLPMETVMPHINLLLWRLASECGSEFVSESEKETVLLQSLDRELKFLANFFTSEGSAVPAAVQIRSLEILSFRYRSSIDSEGGSANSRSPSDIAACKVHTQGALPQLLIALGSPIKGVRRSALSCFESLQAFRASLLEASTADANMKNYAEGRVLLNEKVFDRLVKAIMEFKVQFVADRSHLESFLGMALGAKEVAGDAAGEIEGSEEDGVQWGNLDRRFSASRRKSIVEFLLEHALKLPQRHAQMVLFSSLRFAGHSLAKASATEELLSGLLERRREYHLSKDKRKFGVAAGQKSGMGALSELEVHLVEVLLQMRDEDVAAALTTELSGISGSPSLRTILPALEVEGGQVSDPAVMKPCSAVLNIVTGAYYSALSCEAEDLLFTALVRLAGSDTSEEMRAAARTVISRIKVSTITACRLLKDLCLDRSADDSVLQSSPGGGLTTKSKKKKMKLQQAANVDVIPDTSSTKADRKEQTSDPTNDLRLATNLLEVLQWKADMKNRIGLVRPLFRLLSTIIEQMQVVKKAAEEGSALQEKSATVGEREGVDLERAAGREGPQLPGTSSGMVYLEQLVLMVLEGIAKEVGAGRDESDGAENADAMEEIEDEETDHVGAFDVDVVVQCVQDANDAGTRNHALGLLTAVARLQPDQVIKHVLNVFVLIGNSTLTQDDSYSHRIIQQTLSAVVPHWVRQSQDVSQLLEVFVNALPKVPPHRRLSLVLSLVRAVNEEEGLPVVLQLLFSLSLSGEGKIEVQPSVLNWANNDEAEEEDDTMVEKGVDGSDWVMDFADLLCKQFTPRVRLQALVKVFASDEKRPANESTAPGTKEGRKRGEDGRDWRMQNVVARFVIDQLHARAYMMTGEVATTWEEETLLQDSFVGLMEQVMLKVQSGSNAMAAEKNNSAYSEAMEALYELLGTLNEVTHTPAYLKGVKALIQHQNNSVRQKVLTLFASKVKLHDGESSTKRRQKNQPVRSERQIQTDARLYCAMAQDISKVLRGSDVDSTAIATKQAALVAIEVLALRYGKVSPEVFVTCISAIAAYLQHENRSVESSAIACVTAIVSASGALALPHLPLLVAGLLKAGKTAVDQISLSLKNELDVTALGQKKASVREKERSERIERLANILSAMEVIVENMSAYVSPYVSEFFDLILLQPYVLSCTSGGIASKAEAVRLLVAEKIQPRLLLDPLFSAYEKATAVGERSTAALFCMVRVVADRLDRSSVGMYSGRLFDFFLRAFDLRRNRPPSFTQASEFDDVEAAVVAAFVALVMKLNENAFRPLFVKTLAWAQSEVVDGKSVHANGDVSRNIFLFGLVNELAERLRSVFIPYFKYLLDGVVGRLTDGKEEAAEDAEMIKPKKKKRKSAGSGLREEDWNLRYLVVTSLHKCFLYDTVGFMDASKFQRLLAPLASQLDVEPPASALFVKIGEEEGEAPTGTKPTAAAAAAKKKRTGIPSVEEMDKALVDCLGQMAVTANSDLLWKPLNYEVLRHTRSEHVRTRLLAIAIVASLVDRLKEEFLVLLPETIPFLGELLEDTEMQVVADCQALVKTLESLSGENLSDYF